MLNKIDFTYFIKSQYFIFEVRIHSPLKINTNIKYLIHKKKFISNYFHYILGKITLNNSTFH